MNNPNEIINAIHQEFNFLVETYGFNEILPQPPSAEMYSEVQFEKSNWRIAILATAHSTQISVELISPDKNRASLSFLEISTSNYKKLKVAENLFEDIINEAIKLKIYGNKLLDGNEKDFKIIIEEILKRPENNGIMSAKDMARWENLKEQNHGTKFNLFR
jgi:hypothetical protein